MKILQKGDLTIYRSKDCMDDDLIVIPNECAGARLIFLCSLFMDYGHCLSSFVITEEEYKHLQSLGTKQKRVEKYVDTLYRKYRPSR